MNATDMRQSITAALGIFQTLPLKDAACQILTAGLPRYLQFQPRLQLGQSPRFRG